MFQKTRQSLGALAAATVLTASILSGIDRPAHADEAALNTLHEKITRDYASVRHMTSDQLTSALADPIQADKIVLFDVREVGEHNVSHLKNATQITPGIWTSSFMRKYGDKIKGKTVVFYCSVGRRSSYAASYLQRALKKNGAKGVVNLKGGIFSWHNQKRTLNVGSRQTPYVHPYDNNWGRLIERQSLVRYKPNANPASSVGTFNANSSSGAGQTSQ